jgi:hypothetical protein
LFLRRQFLFDAFTVFSAAISLTGALPYRPFLLVGRSFDRRYFHLRIRLAVSLLVGSPSLPFT